MRRDINKLNFELLETLTHENLKNIIPKVTPSLSRRMSSSVGLTKKVEITPRHRLLTYLTRERVKREAGSPSAVALSKLFNIEILTDEQAKIIIDQVYYWLLAKEYDTNNDFLIENTTCLHKAVELQSLSLVEALLAMGANANRVNDAGQTPLSLSIINGYTEITKLILNHVAFRPNHRLGIAIFESIKQSIKQRDTDLTAELIAKCEETNLSINSLINEFEEFQTGSKIILSFVISNNLSDILDLLIQSGIDVNEALQEAVALSRAEMVATLMDNNANPEIKREGISSLDRAIINSDEQSFKAMVNNSYYIPSEEVKYILLRAVKEDKTDEVTALINKIEKTTNLNLANILNNTQDEETGNVALHYTVINNNPAMTKLLMGQGASISIENKKNFSVLDLAASRQDNFCETAFNNNEYFTGDAHRPIVKAIFHATCRNNESVIQFLLQKLNNADITLDTGLLDSFRDPANGETVLHKAVRTTNPNIVQLLLDNNVSPLAQDNNGILPLTLALDLPNQYFNPKMVALILYESQKKIKNEVTATSLISAVAHFKIIYEKKILILNCLFMNKRFQVEKMDTINFNVLLKNTTDENASQFLLKYMGINSFPVQSDLWNKSQDSNPTVTAQQATHSSSLSRPSGSL